MWVNSFQRVGIDNLNRSTWYKWVNIIKPFLQGSTLFKIEDNIDVYGDYAMLTEYFHDTKA